MWLGSLGLYSLLTMQRPNFPSLIQNELVAESAFVSAVVVNEQLGAYLLHECGTLPVLLLLHPNLCGTIANQSAANGESHKRHMEALGRHSDENFFNLATDVYAEAQRRRNSTPYRRLASATNWKRS